MKILSILRRNFAKYGAPVLLSLLSASYIAQAQIVNPSQPATGVPTAGPGIAVAGQQVSVNYGVANSPFTGNMSIGGTLGVTGASTLGATSATTLSASSTVSGAGFTAFMASPPAIGSTAAGTGAFTTLANSSTFTSTGAAVLNGAVSGTGIATYEANINHVQTYATVAALRALPSCVVGSLYASQGYAAQADSGNAQYVCTSDVASADNGGNIIATATNRLYLQTVGGIVNPKQFGAKCDGATNDFTAFTNALTYGNSLGSATLTMPVTSASCVINSKLTLYPNTVGVEGGGAAWNFGSITTGFAMSFSQSVNDPNARPAYNKAHPMRNLIIIGPGSGTTVAMDMSDHNPAASGTVFTIAGVTLQGLGFQNFPVDIEFGNGAFLINIIASEFYITGGSGYTTSQLFDASTNGGENITYIGCFFGKVQGTAITNNNANASIFTKSSSFDYNAQILHTTGGYQELDGYVETNTDSAYWYDIAGVNTVVKVSGDIVITGNKANFEMFNVQSSATNGGLNLDASIEFAGGVSYTVPSKSLITGTGRAVVVTRGTSSSTVHPAMGGSTNTLANPGFENTNIAEWSLAGTIPPARTTAQFHSGAASLGFTDLFSNPSPPNATKTIACSPGQTATGGFWHMAPTLTGTGATWFVSFAYTDSSGTLPTMTTSTLVGITTNLATWTYVPIGQTFPAPSGTQKASITFTFFGASSGTPAAFLDDVAFSCN